MRSSLRTVLVVAAAGLLAGAAWMALRPRVHRPNIVVVIWDTCRADRLSAFGHSRPTSPCLEALARDGVRYTRCYAPAPWTAPSHGSLFTGVLPHHHGLEVGRGDRIRQDLPTLAETLRRAGYETAGFTANAYLTELTGLNRGFDHFQATYNADGSGRDSVRSVAAVEAWLATRADRERPLFLFVNLMDTHLALDPPEEDLAAVRDPADTTVTDALLLRARAVDGRDALAHLIGWRRLDPPVLGALRVLYDGAVHQVDRNTGDLLDGLRRAGVLGGDAVTVVTADHGENLGEHGEMDHRMSLYDPLLHIPLVVHRAGTHDGGSTVDAQVGLQDVYLTLLEAAGVEPPAGTGLHASLLPRSGGGAGRVVISEFALPREYERDLRAGFPGIPDTYLGRLDVSILSARDPSTAPPARKYLRYTRHDRSGAGALDREELFDTAADPGEEENLLHGGATPEDREHGRRLMEILRSAGSLKESPR